MNEQIALRDINSVISGPLLDPDPLLTSSRPGLLLFDHYTSRLGFCTFPFSLFGAAQC